MKIKSVTLNNFRQFAGQVVVPLSTSDSSPITVIYGTNGGGKTTLLSAVFWAFHGEIPYISASEFIANMASFKSLPEGESMPVSVSLKLEDKGYRFTITRTRIVEKLNGMEVHVSADTLIFKGDDDGVVVTPPQLEINRRFPPNLAKFFFVPGESIDKFFLNSSLPELVENIKAISEIGAYEAAVDLANQVEDRLLRNIAESTSNPRLRQAKDAISALSDELKKFERDIGEASSNLSELLEEEKRLQSAVGSPEEVDKMFADRAKFDQKIIDTKILLGRIDSELLTLVGTRGHLAFIDNLEECVHGALRELGVEPGGKIANLSSEGLNRVAEQDMCICGRHIGEDERKSIRELALENKTAGIGEKVQEMLSFLGGAFSFDNFINDYKTQLLEREEIVKNIRNLEVERETAFANVIDGNPAQETYLALGKVKAEISNLEILVAGLSVKIEENAENTEKANKKLTAEIDRGSTQEVIERQRASLLRVKISLQEALENHRKSFMSELHGELTLLMTEFVFSPVTVELQENFEFNLFLPDGKTPFGEAGGQTKAKAIAMVLALYRIASRKAKEGLALDSEAPAEFPLLIDSAFGELGGELRRRVGVELSKSGAQCVLLVSDTQSPGLIDGLDKGSVGSTLLLHTYVTGSGQDVVTPLIEGKQVTWATFNSPIIKTEVEVLS
jgi:DNA sulfur modification protein DndD